MGRNDRKDGSGEGVISIVGPEMRVTGDLETDATVRIEGRVQGNILAGKAVVIGKDGEVEGDVHTQDAVISGRIQGSLTAASRLEVQATARIDGDVHARRLQLEEGALLNGRVRMSEDGPPAPGEPLPSPPEGKEEVPAERATGGPAPGSVPS